MRLVGLDNKLLTGYLNDEGIVLAIASESDDVAANRVAQLLRSARLDLGLSQEEVAHQAQLSVSTYSSLERAKSPTVGRANPTLDTVARAFRALRIYLEVPRDVR